MLNNLIFLCGPHGSGKTTLGEEIEKENSRVLIPELFSRNIKFNIEPDYRQILKICSRAIENFEYLKIAKENPDKIILGNRCVYDTLCYVNVYYKRGWISKKTCREYNKHAKDFFRDENQNPYAIVVNPGFEVVKKHLEKRWKEKGKKWREEDLEYARLACLEHEKLQDNPLVYYIDHEINLETREDIEDCNTWIEEVYQGRKQILDLECVSREY
jgi:deoxyadenosine/deoxycytidine kinase